MPNVCIYAVTPGSKSKHIVKAGKIAKYNILVIKKKVPPPQKKKKYIKAEDRPVYYRTRICGIITYNVWDEKQLNFPY